VSGIAALAFSLVPSATPAQVEQAIESGAVSIPGVAAGRADAYATLHALAPALTSIGPGQARQEGGGTRARATRTKVVRGRLASRGSRSIVLKTGTGLLSATVEARGRPRIRLSLVAAGRVVASARGSGRASLRTRVRARIIGFLSAPPVASRCDSP
jgi:hypothetical protein